MKFWALFSESDAVAPSSSPAAGDRESTSTPSSSSSVAAAGHRNSTGSASSTGTFYSTGQIPDDDRRTSDISSISGYYEATNDGDGAATHDEVDNSMEPPPHHGRDDRSSDDDAAALSARFARLQLYQQSPKFGLLARKREKERKEDRDQKIREGKSSEVQGVNIMSHAHTNTRSTSQSKAQEQKKSGSTVINDALTSSSSSKLVILPQGVRLNIFNMLSPEDKLTISTVCKKMHRDCHLPHGLLQPPIDPICMFSSDENNIDDDRRGIRLLIQLGNQQRHDAGKKKTLGNHYRIKIENVHQFGTKDVAIEDVYALAKKAKMMGVTELDISVPTQQTVGRESGDFLGAVPLMVPNLRALNLTNIGIHDGTDLFSNFALFCPNLEKIVWNSERKNMDSVTVRVDCIDAEGDALEPVQKLKEIECNNRCFVFLGDLAGANDPKFLFHKCSKNLERVSIKNVSAIRLPRRRPITTAGILQAARRHADTFITAANLQAVLVKFVRKSHSLRYFSSDLTKDNITMLQSERPEILFE